MAAVTPREALSYALSRDMAILYAVVLAGYAATVVGGLFAASWAMRGGGAGLIGQLLSALFFIGGFVGVLGGLIGFIYKVIADATAVATS